MSNAQLIEKLRDRRFSYVSLETREAAAKAIEAAEHWISVSEQAPPQDERVILTDGDNMFFGYGGIEGLLPSITHWMPRPKLPKKAEKGN